MYSFKFLNFLLLFFNLLFTNIVKLFILFNLSKINWIFFLVHFFIHLWKLLMEFYSTLK